jgi:hypothetical protein
MAGRLNSADMRAWLTQFLQSPCSLPTDPDSGNERISLTLPREQVRDLAGYLQCSPSIALRRLAVARLDATTALIAPRLAPQTVPVSAGSPRPSRTTRPASVAGSRKETSHDNSGLTAASQAGTAAGGIVIFIGFLIVEP